MCPNCGKKIGDGELCFNLSKAIEDMLKEFVNETKKDNEKQELNDGIEYLFNGLQEELTSAQIAEILDVNKKNIIDGKDSNPACFSEKELWGMSQYGAVDDDLSSFRTIEFKFPIDRILKYKGVVEKNDKDNITKDLWNFLSSNRDILLNKEHYLRLQKTGDSNDSICFDKIENYPDIKRRCPRCLGKMSYWAGRYEEITLSVLGGPRVSKSTAVVACAAAFMSAVKPDPLIRWELSEEDEGVAAFKKDYLEVYQTGTPIEATNLNSSQIPRVSFRVTIGVEREHPMYICLTFVDVPGELNSDKDSNNKFNELRYPHIFPNIDFIWYCTDIGEVGQLAKEDLKDLGRGEEAAISRAKIKDNMSKLNSYFKHKTKIVPVAYILGKTDSRKISDDDKEEYELYPSDENDKRETSLPFNVRSFYFRSEKVKKYMEKQGSGELVDTFDKLFRDGHCYIAMSAYGFDPAHTEDYIPNPYHSKEAFYWMLALSGLIDICTERNEITGLFIKRVRTVDDIAKLGSFDEEYQETIRHNLCMKGPYKVAR